MTVQGWSAPCGLQLAAFARGRATAADLDEPPQAPLPQQQVVLDLAVQCRLQAGPACKAGQQQVDSGVALSRHALHGLTRQVGQHAGVPALVCLQVSCRGGKQLVLSCVPAAECWKSALPTADII